MDALRYPRTWSWIISIGLHAVLLLGAAVGVLEWERDVADFEPDVFSNVREPAPVYPVERPPDRYDAWPMTPEDPRFFLSGRAVPLDNVLGVGNEIEHCGCGCGRYSRRPASAKAPFFS